MIEHDDKDLVDPAGFVRVDREVIKAALRAYLRDKHGITDDAQVLFCSRGRIRLTHAQVELPPQPEPAPELAPELDQDERELIDRQASGTAAKQAAARLGIDLKDAVALVWAYRETRGTE